MAEEILPATQVIGLVDFQLFFFSFFDQIECFSQDIRQLTGNSEEFRCCYMEQIKAP